MKLSDTLFLILATSINGSEAIHIDGGKLNNTGGLNSLSSLEDSFLVLKAGSQDGLAYYTNVSIGSNQQQNSIRIDLVQPYIWTMNGYNYPECQGLEFSAYTDSNATCVNHGTYDISESTTGYQHPNSWEMLGFINSVCLNGSVVNDNVEIEDLTYGDNNANITLDHIDFFNANQTNVYLGALGLGGLSDNNENANFNISFLNILKENGVINSSSYSWFPKNAYELDLTFGVVNQSQYIGPFVNFDAIPFYDHDTDNLSYELPILPLTDIIVNNNAQDSSVSVAQNNNIPVLLDSRSFYSRLPYSTIINLAIQLNAVYSDDQGIWYVKCSIGDLDASIGFRFGNVTVQVPVGSFIKQFSSTNNSTVVFENGDPACYMTVIPDYFYGYSMLGTNFLQNAYFVVDYDSSQIAIAQAKNDILSSSLGSKTPRPRTTLITSASANSTTIITSTLPSMSSFGTLPLESSIIGSGTIPFAVTNNVTGSWTLSYKNEVTTTRVVPAEISAVYSSGTIYTGGRFNTTSTSSETALSAYGLRNAEFGYNNKMGLIGLLTMLLFGIAL